MTSYYDKFANEFAKMARNVDPAKMEKLYAAVERNLPENATILDLGCGEGRDAHYFGSHGHKVIAIDNSKELINLANQRATRNATFIVDDFTKGAIDRYAKDGTVDLIWACASLLHTFYDTLMHTIAESWRALKPGGQMFMSFKYNPLADGKSRLNYTVDGEVEIPHRLYLDMNSKVFGSILDYLEWGEIKFSKVETWISKSAKNTDHEVPSEKLDERAEERWFNIILTK